MTPNPILKVLSTLQIHRVQCLLMGGQACVYYGAAEFSRDTDVALLAEPENLRRLAESLKALQAQVIAVPPLELSFLVRGHAVHFRCLHPDVEGMRLDVMSVMRGLDGFEKLWLRRTTAELESGERLELISLPDLVAAKKTQRDKDWPMIRRLVEADYQQADEAPSRERIQFWLREARTPSLLREVAGQFLDEHKRALAWRPLLGLLEDEEATVRALVEEELIERERDRLYWKPLKEELEKLRHRRG